MLCASSGAPDCIAIPSSLRLRIMPPVTPSKLANAGVFTRWRSALRLSAAGSWCTADLPDCSPSPDLRAAGPGGQENGWEYRDLKTRERKVHARVLDYGDCLPAHLHPL